MKANLFLFFIAIVISGLLFYGLYAANSEKLIYPIVAAVVNLVFLGFAVGISFKDAPRSSVMAKIASGIFFGAALILNILFAVFKASDAVLIISNGLMLAVWSAIIYGISKTNQ